MQMQMQMPVRCQMDLYLHLYLRPHSRHRLRLQARCALGRATEAPSSEAEDWPLVARLELSETKVVMVRNKDDSGGGSDWRDGEGYSS